MDEEKPRTFFTVYFVLHGNLTLWTERAAHCGGRDSNSSEQIATGNFPARIKMEVSDFYINSIWCKDASEVKYRFNNKVRSAITVLCKTPSAVLGYRLGLSVERA